MAYYQLASINNLLEIGEIYTCKRQNIILLYAIVRNSRITNDS